VVHFETWILQGLQSTNSEQYNMKILICIQWDCGSVMMREKWGDPIRFCRLEVPYTYSAGYTKIQCANQLLAPYHLGVAPGHSSLAHFRIRNSCVVRASQTQQQIGYRCNCTLAIALAD
jgi:hypothetical protein